MGECCSANQGPIKQLPILCTGKRFVIRITQEPFPSCYNRRMTYSTMHHETYGAWDALGKTLCSHRTTCAIQDNHAGIHNIYSGVTFQELNLRRNPLRMHDVIGIHPRQVLPRRKLSYLV